MRHSHPCRYCRTPVDCWGEWERNHDGWPEAVCAEYHLPGGEIDEPICPSCQAADAREHAIEQETD